MPIQLRLDEDRYEIEFRPSIALIDFHSMLSKAIIDVIAYDSYDSRSGLAELDPNYP
jgi:hypothetical protein